MLTLRNKRVCRRINGVYDSVEQDGEDTLIGFCSMYALQAARINGVAVLIEGIKRSASRKRGSR